LLTQQLHGGGGGGGGAGGAAQRYAGWRDAAASIVRDEGAAALFRGVKTRVAMLSFGGACFLGTWEEAKRRLLRLA